jgi:cell division protein FtsN
VGRATTGKPDALAAAGVGPFWVQVGAFRDEGHAKALAARLRADNVRVEELRSGDGSGGPATAAESPAPIPAGDKYDVFVSGASSEDVNAKLAGRGLSADPVAGGAVIRPSLPLRDAVALSKDLATEGLKVQVRRAAAPARPPAVATTDGGDVLYRVRVGGFRDRATAEAAREALAARGFSGFVGREGG